MPRHNPDNERIKRRYFAYLRDGNGRSTPTVDAAAAAIARFETATKFRNFKQYHFEQAIAFKRRLAGELGPTGRGLSKATLNSILNHLQRFFHWLAGQQGYKSRFSYSDSDYFKLSDNDVRIATARVDREPPTIEQITHVIEVMSGE